jgi:hypothetical protein
VRAIFKILVLAVTAGSPERVLDGRLELSTDERRTEPSAQLRSVLSGDGGIASVVFLPDGGTRFHVLVRTLEWRPDHPVEPGDYGPYEPPYVHRRDEKQPR